MRESGPPPVARADRSVGGPVESPTLGDPANPARDDEVPEADPGGSGPGPVGDAPPGAGAEVSTSGPEPVRSGEPTIVDFFAGSVDAEAATLGDGPPAASCRRAAPRVPGFEVFGEIGRGGMGVVYLARRTLLNRKCALKMILAGEHAEAEAAVRFLAEAEAVARLSHPNVIRIHSIGEHEGFPYLELEYVEAGSLEGRLEGKPWPARDAVKLVEALARGVAEAHRLGIVHRDLKPANVLMTGDGVPKVTDFGLAKCVGVDSGLTVAESIIGSPSYMAPEQAFGRAHEAGPRADVYGLGAILYELLTGRPPFIGTNMYETLEQVRTAEPVRPSRLVPGLPRDLETIVMECLHKDPARRFATASDLADDLHRFLGGRPIRARRIGEFERLWKWARRRPVLAASLVVSFASMLGGTAASTCLLAFRAGKEMAARAIVIDDRPMPPRVRTDGVAGLLLRVVLGDDLSDLMEDLRDGRDLAMPRRPDRELVRPVPGGRVLAKLADLVLQLTDRPWSIADDGEHE